MACKYPIPLPYARRELPCPDWLTPARGRELIDRGWELWEDGKPYVLWQEGRWLFRLSATNLRLLLDWKPASGKHGWQRGRCRYNG